MEIELFSDGCPHCLKKTETERHCFFEGHEYVTCKDCDVIFQIGKTDLDAILACYTGGPIKQTRRKLFNQFRKIENQRDFDLRMSRARAIFEYSSSFVKGPGTYLDIGCNKGFNLYAAEERSWDVYGNELIEVLTIPIKNSKPHLKDRIKTGSFLDLSPQYQDNTFDLITCIDVIEHLVDPIKGAREMLRILKPGGVIVYQTVDVTPENRAMKENWGGLKANEHLVCFNTTNFKTFAETAGFENVTFAPEPFEVCDGNFVAICRKPQK